MNVIYGLFDFLFKCKMEELGKDWEVEDDAGQLYFVQFTKTVAATQDH